MSRIGRLPIQLPNGVTVDLKGTTVTVKGTKGVLSRSIHPDMLLNMDNGVLEVKRPSALQHHRALHGLTRTLINNMVMGVSAGYKRKLQVEGVGYRAELQGSNLVLMVGYSHPVVVSPPSKETKFEIEDRGRIIVVSGIDKEIVGEICAKIRGTRPPEPYKGKGIRYEGEVVRRKAGKSGKV